MAEREVVTLNEATPQLEVPQSGDTYKMPRDVAVTGKISTTQYIDLTPITAPTHTEGRLFYDVDEDALSYYNDATDVTINIGQENVLKVRNTTGVTITNGQVVYVNGAQGGYPTVALAQATSNHQTVLGVATHDIANAAEGYVTTFGIVRGINLAAFSAGDVVYLSTTPGGMIATKPTHPTEAVELGIVLDNGATGKVFVSTDHVYLHSIVEDTSPQLGGNLDVNGYNISSVSNGDVNIAPDGTGNVLLGNYEFDVDQTVGVGQDNYVLTYDNATGHISLEESTGGGASSPLTTKGDIWVYSTTDDRLPIGTDDYVLTADSTAGTGMAWKVAAGGGGWDIDDDTGFNYGHGLSAGAALNVASGSLFLGYKAGAAVTDGSNNVFMGRQAGEKSTGNSANNVAIGAYSYFNSTSNSQDNTLVGASSGYSLTGGDENVAVGTEALRQLTSQGDATAVGFEALRNATSGGSTAVGHQALTSVTSGFNNVGVGWNAGDNLTLGDYGIFIGASVDAIDVSSDDQLVIGNGQVNPISGYMGARSDVDYSTKKLTITGTSAYASAATNQNGGDLELLPGQPASGGGTKGSLILDGLNWPAADGTANQVIQTDGAGNLTFATAGGGGGWDVEDTVNGNYGHGLSALDAITGTALANIAIGESAGTALTTGDRNIAIGTDSLKTGTGNEGSVGIGYGSLFNSTGDGNTAIGRDAGKDITTGTYNICLGYNSGSFATSITSGSYNFLFGDAVPDSSTASYQFVVGVNSTVPAIKGYMGARADIDHSTKDLTITGPSAYSGASTNQSGGDLRLRPGQPASGGGSAGNIILTDLPTSDPTVAGALWNSSGTLMISAG